MKQLKQVPFLKLGVNTLLHSGAQAGANFLCNKSDAHNYIAEIKKLVANSALTNQQANALRDAFTGLNEDHAEINGLKVDKLNGLTTSDESTGKLIQNICGDVGGNIAATSAVTALKIFGISEKAELLTKGFISENTLGTVAGAISNALVSSTIKLDFTNPFQLVMAGIIGGSSGFRTIEILKGQNFDALDQQDVDFDALAQQNGFSTIEQ